MACNWFKKNGSAPKIPSAENKSPAAVLIDIASKFIGMHEDKNSNRAEWLDIIQRRAGMIGEPWCAIIVFWEWIPQAEQVLKAKCQLIPCAHVRTGANLNRSKLHKNPKAGDIGYLGRVGSSSGHQIVVKEAGLRDAGGEYYTTVEGNTSASDGSNRDGGEVASHKRYRGTHGGLEEIGFATPFV